MTTSYSTDAARSYLDRVKGLLADLPEEERVEVVQDLAAHLDELEPDVIEAELGTPEAFVAEFRTMAGLGTHAERRRGLLSHLIARIDALDSHPAIAKIVGQWRSVRPVWIAVRGWLLVSFLVVLYGDEAAFAPFPFPNVGGSGLGGLVAVTIVTLISVTAARKGENGAWRLANGVFNGAVAVFLVGCLLYGTLYTSDELNELAAEREWQTLEAVNHMLPHDLVGATPDGARLDGVLLYDENGTPFDLTRLRWELGLPGPIGEIEGLDPEDEGPFNLYPLATHLGQIIGAEDPFDILEQPTPTTTTVP